jgi:hypothetical protein
MEFFFYASYAMSALIVLLETISIRLEKQSEHEPSRRRKLELHKRREQLNLAGRIIYPSILLAVIAAGALVYNGTIQLGARAQTQTPSLASTIIKQAVSFVSLVQPTQPEPSTNAADRPVVLRLRTWRPEDTRPMQVILDGFHEYARDDLRRDITVLYEPVIGISYDLICSMSTPTPWRDVLHNTCCP